MKTYSIKAPNIIRIKTGAYLGTLHTDFAILVWPQCNARFEVYDFAARIGHRRTDRINFRVFMLFQQDMAHS